MDNLKVKIISKNMTILEYFNFDKNDEISNFLKKPEFNFEFDDDNAFLVFDAEKIKLTKESITYIIREIQKYLESRIFFELKSKINDRQVHFLQRDFLAYVNFKKDDKMHLENFREANLIFLNNIDNLSTPQNYEFMMKYDEDYTFPETYYFLDFFKKYEKDTENKLLKFI